MYKPGWLMPGEAEDAAKLLGLTLKEFFDKYLGVDWWEASEADETGDGTDVDIFVLAPALVNAEPGCEYPGNPRGKCVFYKNELCKINKAKPHECAKFLHNEKEMVKSKIHWKVASAWNTKENQSQIAELLGREPEAEQYMGGLFGGLLGESGW